MANAKSAVLPSLVSLLLLFLVARTRDGVFGEVQWKTLDRVLDATTGKPILGNPDEAISLLFRKIGSGQADESDDEKLVDIVKGEIVKTAGSIRNPSGSIELAALRAQNLVSELTSAYTTAIYKSRTVENARLVFIRFRDTVQRIVDFIRTGEFIA